MLLQKINKSRGFTIIELMVAIAIFAIAGAIIIPGVVLLLQNEVSETPPELEPQDDPSSDPNEADPANEEKGESNRL